MADASGIQRQLKIKAGSARRLQKEHRSYEKEEEDLNKKLQKLLGEGGEEWYIKNAKNMIQETQKLIVDSSKRLGDATQDLRELIVSSQKVLPSDNEELAKAKETLQEVSV